MDFIREMFNWVLVIQPALVIMSLIMSIRRDDIGEETYLMRFLVCIGALEVLVGTAFLSFTGGAIVHTLLKM